MESCGEGMKIAKWVLRVFVAAWALQGMPLAADRAAELYDVVILHGRVMDPESNLDAIRNVGISGGKIRAISQKELRGKETIEARGLLVAPGFIDLHQHGQDPKNYEFKARDGVTTHDEILDVFRIAAAARSSVHVHLRHAGLKEPTTGLVGLQEVVADAAATGASLHVVHITSMGLRNTPTLISVVKGARDRGLDITTECYPYTAGSTALESAIFDEGWQERQGITYKDVQWAKTGERLTAETFAKYRREGGAVVVFSIPEEAARVAGGGGSGKEPSEGGADNRGENTPPGR